MIEYISPYPNDGLLEDEATYTGLRLSVTGQHWAQQYQPGEDEVCISISSKGWGVPFTELSDKFVDILRLDFADVMTEDDGDSISDAQADQVAAFVMKHKDKKHILIHCFAGMNRSRSMAAAIALMLRLPYQFTVNNQSVYWQVRRAFLRLRQEEKKDGDSTTR